jgi:hypothetical protein
MQWYRKVSTVLHFAVEPWRNSIRSISCFSTATLISSAIASISVGILDVKHYFHLQLVPHLSRYHQYWRLAASHLPFGSSPDLLVGLIILFNVSIPVERRFGSVKFASFLVVSALVATILQFTGLLLFHKVGLNHMVSGPIAITFSVLYQYWRLLPSVYRFRIFGVPFSDKSFHYLLALQLAFTHGLSSLAPAVVGILTGQIYRSDLANLKSYRISPTVVDFATQFVAPSFGSSRPPRRSNRVFPEPPSSSSSTSASLSTELLGMGSAARARALRGPTATRASNNETGVSDSAVASPTGPSASPVARQSPGGSSSDSVPESLDAVPARDTAANNTPSAVREWVDQLTGRAERARSGMRIPTEAEVTQLGSMFPGMPRDVIVGALQRSSNTEAAVETLLTSQLD